MRHTGPRSNRALVARGAQGAIEELERRTLLASPVASLGPDGFGYTAAAHPYEDLTLNAGDPGTFTLIDWADDYATAVDLGSNTFSIYGRTYGGADQMYVSSNGLISFGQSYDAYSNDDIENTAGDAVICPLWDDWIGPGGGDAEETGSAGAGMVLGRFESTAGDGRPERLILQWTADHYDSTPSTVRFAAILQLNTAADAPGDITFNYADLDAGDGNFDNGASATVGIRDLAFAQTNRLLVSQDGAVSPLLGDHKAILIRSDAAGHPHADAGGPYTVDEASATPTITLDGSHSSDPDQAASTLIYAWDLDGDGIFGETGDAAEHGDETGIHPTFENLAGLGTGVATTVILRVTDSANLSSFASAAISIINHPPTAGVSGPGSAQAIIPYTITLSATDPSSASFTWSVDWGDETSDYWYSDERSTTTQATHSYQAQGDRTITVTAFDDQDAASDPKTLHVSVGPRPDVLLSDDGTLIVTGTSGNDTITLSLVPDTGSGASGGDMAVRLVRNGTVSLFAPSDGKNVQLLDIQTNAGDDRIDAANVSLPQQIDAGDGDDTILTGSGADTIEGGGGDNSIEAGAGFASVTTGSGKDTITTGSSDDQIDSGEGDDSVDSGDGYDSVNAGGGDNVVHVHAGVVNAGDGDDTITADGQVIDTGDDTSVGGRFVNGVVIDCGGGDDSVTTSDGEDAITFGTGNETITTGGGADRVIGGGDPDTGRGAIIDTAAPDDADPGTDNDVVACVFAKSIDTGIGNDVIGCNFAGLIHAGDGDDRVRCGSDADHPAVVFGDAGDDDLRTGPGADSIYAGTGRDTVHAGSGDDLISGAGGNDRLFGQDGNDQLFGGRGNDRLEGQGGDDRLIGGSGADLVRGGEGTNAATPDDPLDELTDIQNDLVS